MGRREHRGGRLSDGTAAPTHGERTIALADGHGFIVEQILSGQLSAPVDYLQEHDEWCVVLDGEALLEVDGTPHALARGDWLLLPAKVPHRLVRTEGGTNWLVVRATGTRQQEGVRSDGP